MLTLKLIIGSGAVMKVCGTQHPVDQRRDVDTDTAAGCRGAEPPGGIEDSARRDPVVSVAQVVRKTVRLTEHERLARECVVTSTAGSLPPANA
jgi:hypothetical protein